MDEDKARSLLSNVFDRVRRKREAAAVSDDDLLLPPGHVVSQTYTIVRRLARGGQGEVYLATAGLHVVEKYALKIIDPNREGGALTTHLLELEGEMRKVSFSHPNVVRYEGRMMTDTYAGRTFQYIVMEFVAGVSLLAASEPQGANAADLLMAVEPLADALDRLHEAGIFHCDIAPSNIILRDDDWSQPVLIDFGVARTKSSAVVTGDKFAGRSAFASRERRALQVDCGTDLYSLGMTLLAAVRNSSASLSLRDADDRPNLDGVQERLAAVIRKLTDPPGARVARGRDLIAYMRSGEFLALKEPAGKTGFGLAFGRSKDSDPKPPGNDAPLHSPRVQVNVAQSIQAKNSVSAQKGLKGNSQRKGASRLVYFIGGGGAALLAAVLVAIRYLPIADSKTAATDIPPSLQKNSGGAPAATVAESGGDANVDPAVGDPEASPPEPATSPGDPTSAAFAKVIELNERDPRLVAMLGESPGSIDYAALTLDGERVDRALSGENRLEGSMLLTNYRLNMLGKQTTLLDAMRTEHDLKAGASFSLRNDADLAVSLEFIVDPEDILIVSEGAPVSGARLGAGQSKTFTVRNNGEQDVSEGEQNGRELRFATVVYRVRADRGDDVEIDVGGLLFLR